jgi:hypothetical protein
MHLRLPSAPVFFFLASDSELNKKKISTIRLRNLYFMRLI